MRVMSKTMVAALDQARKIEHKLKAGDRRYRRAVMISMDDGSFFVWESAFYESCIVGNETWYLVFPEHYPAQVFCHEEVLSIREVAPTIPRKPKS